MEWREYNRAKVLQCLQNGEYEAIVTCGQSELDVLAHLAAELGILEAVKLIEVKRERAGIPERKDLRQRRQRLEQSPASGRLVMCI